MWEQIFIAVVSEAVARQKAAALQKENEENFRAAMETIRKIIEVALRAERISKCKNRLDSLERFMSEFAATDGADMDKLNLIEHEAQFCIDLMDDDDLQLHTDRLRPARKSREGGMVTTLLDNDLVDALSQLSRVYKTSLFMTLLSACFLLLSRNSGRDDVAIGSTVVGRKDPAVQSAMGRFANMVPLRCNLSGNPTYEQVFDRVRSLCLSTYEHQDFPFIEILRATGYRRGVNRSRPSGPYT